mgnify:CR=1 FL=1
MLAYVRMMALNTVIVISCSGFAHVLAVATILATVVDIIGRNRDETYKCRISCGDAVVGR